MNWLGAELKKHTTFTLAVLMRLLKALMTSEEYIAKSKSFVPPYRNIALLTCHLDWANIVCLLGLLYSFFECCGYSCLPFLNVFHVANLSKIQILLHRNSVCRRFLSARRQRTPWRRSVVSSSPTCWSCRRESRRRWNATCGTLYRSWWTRRWSPRSSVTVWRGYSTRRLSRVSSDSWR